MDIVVAMVLGQVHEHTCSTAPLSGTTETAVTDAPAGGAKPLLEKHNDTSAICSNHLLTCDAIITHMPKLMRCINTNRVQEGIVDLFSIAVPETRPAELSANTHTFWVAAVGLGVSCFLATLMAGGTLMNRSTVTYSETSRETSMGGKQMP